MYQLNFLKMSPNFDVRYQTKTNSYNIFNAIFKDLRLLALLVHHSTRLFKWGHSPTFRSSESCQFITNLDLLFNKFKTYFPYILANIRFMEHSTRTTRRWWFQTQNKSAEMAAKISNALNFHVNKDNVLKSTIFLKWVKKAAPCSW